TFLQKAQKYNNVGNVYFKMGKQNEAIVQYNKAVDICPKENVANLAIFYQNRAAAYEQLKKYSSVKADCTKALELNPEYTKAFRRRAHVLEQIGDLEAAIKDWIAVCVDEGFSDHVSLSKADKVLDKFQIQCAEESWMQKKLLMPIKYSIELYFMTFSKDPVFCRLQCPENIPEFFKKPFKAFKDQKYDDIIPLCTEIIKSPEFETLSSTKLEILLLRATFYLLMGDYSAAIQDFENVLSNEDLSDDLRINVLIKRADLHMQLKYFEKSFEDFELAISINSTCSDIYYHRGWAHVFMHRENEAKLDFEKALEYNPNFITAHIQKCCLDYCIAKSNGDIILIKAAIEAVERTFVKYQNFPECKLWYLLYTEIMLSFQQYQKVDTYLAKVIEKDPKCALAYINRGLIQLCNGNIGKSMEYIHKAIKIDEKFGLPYEILGIIETKKGNLEDAIRLFDKAIIYSTTFKEVLTICKEKIATKIELYIRNQLDIEHTPRLFQSFSRFSDIHIEAELLDCLIS
ncbi:Mitochondrial import receptor subunit TOM70, partial [Cyphomyrmex costatus]